MILLERGNRILGETVSSQLTRDPEEKAESIQCDVKLCDFDDVHYRVLIENENKDVLKVAMAMPCYSVIADLGARENFQQAYGPLVCESPLDKYDVTIAIKINELKDQKQKDELTTRVSMIKAHTLGGVFDYFFKAVLVGKVNEPFTFNLRADTSIYFFPAADRCTVIFGLDFKEKVDRAVAKVMLQEFAESRRNLQAAPFVTFTVQPPSEMSHFKITEPTGNLGFVAFAVTKSHVEKDRKERVIAVMSTFRNYLQYHIKCSKSHFHSRMRARVFSLLQILNRAKAETPATGGKTATGKTFVRKV